MQGAFELDCTVCPIAIKYNKIFVDAFWNSKKYVFLLLLLYSAFPPSKMLQWNPFRNNGWHILNIFGCATGNHSPCI